MNGLLDEKYRCWSGRRLAPVGDPIHRDVAVPAPTTRPGGEGDRVPTVTNDLSLALTSRVEGIAALQAYQRDAEVAGDPAVRAAFERLEQRSREDVATLRGLLGERR